MEEGILLTTRRFGAYGVTWSDKKDSNSLLNRVFNPTGEHIKALKCKDCGFIEMYA